MKTARNSVVYTGGQIASSLVVFVALVAFARLLRPQLFGLFTVVIAFYTLLALVGNFAIGTAIRKKLPERRGRGGARSLIINAYAAALLLSVAVAALGALFSGYAAANIYHQPSISVPLAIASLLVVFWTLFNVTISVLVSLDRVLETVVMDIVYSLLYLGVGVAAVMLGYGIVGALAGLAVGIVAATLVGFAYLPRWVLSGSPRPDGSEIRGIVRFSTPAFISNMALRGIASFGVLFLALFVGSALVGNYNAAYTVGSFVAVVITSFSYVLLPAFSDITFRRIPPSRIGSAFDRSVHLTTLFLAPIVVFLASVAKPLISLFFSASYSHAPLYLSLIAAGSAIGLVWNYASTLMLGSGDLRRFIRYQAAAALVELASVLILTPLFHVVGMIVGLFLISQVAIDVMYIFALERKFGFRPRVLAPSMAALSALAVFALLYTVSYVLGGGYATIAVNLALTLLLYPPLAAAFGGVSARELGFLTELVGRRALARPALYLIRYAGLFVSKAQKG